MIKTKLEVLHDAIIQHFEEEHIEYIDKTPKRGSIYFFNKDVAIDLQDKGFKVAFASKGTKGTNNRPAWYVVFKE